MKQAALISLTPNGARLASLLASGLPEEWECRRFCYEKYPADGAESFTHLKLLVKSLFVGYDALIFLCACGIAVRMCAPYLVSKRSDPAVIAVDEQGRFAVSLLSGHLGGANALTRKIASVLGATPVITTATDSAGKFAPDCFAQANGLYIVEPDAAKQTAAAVVRGEKIGLRCHYPVVNLPADTFDHSAKDIGICIAENSDAMPFAVTLHLLPKNIVLGVGCKRGTLPEKLEAFLLQVLRDHGIPVERVAALHTVDVKRDEPAILAFCDKYGIPLEVYSPAELMAVEGTFARSDFVMRAVGTDNVCERSAVIGGQTLRIARIARDGMTFAAGQRPVNLDFGRGTE